MISIKGSKSFKSVIILVFATFLIGNVVALSWENPSGDLTSDPFSPNVSEIDGDEAVNFSLIEVDGDNSYEDREASIGDDYAYYDEFNPGDDNSGRYDLVAESYDSGGDTLDSISKEITVDGTSPEVEFPDYDYVSAYPSITVELGDEHTGISGEDSYSASADNNADVESVSGFDECSAGNSCSVTFDIDTGEMSTGDDFSLEVTVEDRVGNQEVDNKIFTFDDSFQADQPEFELVDADNNLNVRLDGDADVDVTVGNIDQEESEVKVSCRVEGDEVDSTGWSSTEDFSCSIPFEDVEETTSGISVEACDRAGNCDTSSERYYTFDAEDPVLELFETTREYRVYTGDFFVEYEAFDAASGIDRLEYFFYPGTSQGDGNAVEFDGEDEFRVDTALLDEEGEHTVYLRAVDNVGRWSSIESIDFEYYPDEEPQMSIDAEENFSVEANQTGYMNVIVENTGKLLIESETIEASSEILEGERTVEGLEEGDRQNAEFELSPRENETGIWDVTFSSQQIEASDTVQVLVEASDSQRDHVDSELSRYSELRDDLEANISGLRESGLNGELNSTLNTGTSEFTQNVKTIQEHVDQGEYHRALAVVDRLEASYQSASSTLSEIEEQHRKNELKSGLLKLFVGLSMIAVAVGAFVYTGRRDDIDFEFSEFDFEMPDNSIGEKVEEVVEKVKDKASEIRDKIAEEEEQVEEKFDGFR